MLDNDQIGNVNVNQLQADAASLKSGLGAIAWAALEMFKRGGRCIERLHWLKKNAFNLDILVIVSNN